ncbi:MAG: hypothetical protein HWD61_01340 [Parachlamydiaceae bacterium]|nr:MAG: hypothetical protein HWD61_01340 [Parachlamydiaceae bacterium]
MENARRYFQASVLLKLQTFGLSETNVLETLFSVPTPEALQNYLAQQTKDFSALTDLPEKSFQRCIRKMFLQCKIRQNYLNFPVPFVGWGMHVKILAT